MISTKSCFSAFSQRIIDMYTNLWNKINKTYFKFVMRGE